MKKNLILLLLATSFVSACNEDKPKVIEFTSFAQYMTKENQIAENTTQLKIIFFKEMTMYVIPRIDEYVNSGREIESYTYNVIKKNMKYGVTYKPDKKEIQKVNLDSLLEFTNLNRNNINLFSLDFGKPINIDTAENKNIVIERFVSKMPSFLPDSIYRFYNFNIKNNNFSLSPSLDKAKYLNQI